MDSGSSTGEIMGHSKVHSPYQNTSHTAADYTLSRSSMPSPFAISDHIVLRQPVMIALSSFTKVSELQFDREHSDYPVYVSGVPFKYDKVNTSL